MLTKSAALCIESDPRSASSDGPGAHHPAQGGQGGSHHGDTDWRLGIVVDHRRESAHLDFATQLPAPDRVAAPVARRAPTARETAAYLIGASGRRDVEARVGNLSLIRLPEGGFVLYCLVTGDRVACPTPSAVVAAVAASRA
jgi:hypothetical protein